MNEATLDWIWLNKAQARMPRFQKEHFQGEQQIWYANDDVSRLLMWGAAVTGLQVEGKKRDKSVSR